MQEGVPLVSDWTPWRGPGGLAGAAAGWAGVGGTTLSTRAPDWHQVQRHSPRARGTSKTHVCQAAHVWQSSVSAGHWAACGLRVRVNLAQHHSPCQLSSRPPPAGERTATGAHIMARVGSSAKSDGGPAEWQHKETSPAGSGGAGGLGSLPDGAAGPLPRPGRYEARSPAHRHTGPHACRQETFSAGSCANSSSPSRHVMQHSMHVCL